jgi:hypothetical protein
MRWEMSDTFAFRALPIPLYRRLNLRVLKAILVLSLVVATVGAFARWTIRSEQASFVDVARHESVSEADAATAQDGDRSFLDLPASGVEPIATVDVAVQEVARRTLARAQRLLAARGSLIAAGPGRLAPTSKHLTFTDGPSIGPSIVSLSGTDAAWGAAVMSESGLCFAVSLDAAGIARYGTLASSCTGAAALQVTGLNW